MPSNASAVSSCSARSSALMRRSNNPQSITLFFLGSNAQFVFESGRNPDAHTAEYKADVPGLVNVRRLPLR
jgi:hypothetical protein